MNEPPLPLSMQQRTYSGLLDDVMVRYGSDFVGRDFFNRMLAKSLFFGGGLYLNDGYLVNHPHARDALRDENSLLRVMIRTGFVRILTRGRTADDLARMPETMAAQNNQSFAELIASPEWAAFAPIWKKLSYSAFYANTARPWPDFDMSASFTKLMMLTFAAKPADLGLKDVSGDEWRRIRDDFLSRRPQESGPRDKYEKANLKILGERTDLKTVMDQMMTIGNQAYHYNFGLTLTEEDEIGVAVDTTIGAAFDELLQTREISRGQLDDLPVMWLPKNFPLDNGDVFEPLVSSDSDAYAIKLDYLESLSGIIEDVDGRGWDDARRRLAEATRRYQIELTNLLAPRFGRLDLERVFGDSFEVAFGVLSPGETDLAVATAAPSAALAITIQSEANARGRQFLTERFKLRDVSSEYSQDTENVFRFHEVRPRVASLAFDKEKAKSFVQDIPPAPASNLR